MEGSLQKLLSIENWWKTDKNSENFPSMLQNFSPLLKREIILI